MGNFCLLPFTSYLMKVIPFMRFSWFKYQLPIIIFIVMCLIFFIAPMVYASSSISLNQVSTWAIGILGLTTLMLVVYLLIVIFQPERF
ncbi:potassium-transporting ATPase subunit F [Anabaena sp. UHCC 0187]|nr:potassium-transporting ATPase subunit F [Anabaena sp. UHCC 0187]